MCFFFLVTRQWEKRWVKSEARPKKERGSWSWARGRLYDANFAKAHPDGPKEDKGLQTKDGARFFGISAKMNHTIANDGRELVVQFSVKHGQKIDCGGGYIKVLPAGLRQKKFAGNDEYAIMFGPDICGTALHRVQVIFHHAASGENLPMKKEVQCETDEYSHLYTLVVRPDNTYEVQIDGATKASGSLYDDWDFLAPREIADPDHPKPEDWVDEAQIPDPNDLMPDGYDELPRQIPDPRAGRPGGWDEKEDGEWVAPMIDNPEFRGEWQPRMVANPVYSGEWAPPMMANPDFVDDTKVHAVCKDCEFVGIELWQVKAGSIFDDIIITDSLEEAVEYAKETFFVKAPAEKEMKAEQIRKKRESDEAAARKKEEKEREKARKGKKKKIAAEEDDETDDYARHRLLAEHFFIQ